MIRERLPKRNGSENSSFTCSGVGYIATVSKFADGRVAEIFLSSNKSGSDTAAAARDCAVITSLALQHGTPVDVIRGALLRDTRGVASSPIGIALDLLAAGEP